MKQILSLFIFFFVFSNPLLAQESTTPLSDYTWKRGKTVAEDGYVVLKSGKRLEGVIVLKGSENTVEEVIFEGEGKKIEFPVAALKSYGLLRKINANGQSTSANGPINDSPESMYEWRDMGVVMNKKITSTQPRDGYVILKNGTRYDGLLKLRRKDGVLSNYQVKGDKRYKGDISEVARYGYTVSEESVIQENLEKQANKFYPGSIQTKTGMQQGEISTVSNQKFYSNKIIFKDDKGAMTEYVPSTLTSFSQEVKGETKKYVAYKDTFVQEDFSGDTFQLFRNPYPTSTNKFLTGLVKETIVIGTNAAAQGIAKKDAKKNGYETRMDSIIANSPPEDLIGIRDGLVKLSGYTTAEELQEKSDNESLKNNINALNLALAGYEVRNSEGGLYNKEWIILNKKSGEETVIYKAKYKTLMEPLLKGCYEYLSLDRGDQRAYEKWSNIEQTIKMLDGCY
ncbi:hypothetical protein [uncultured Dokdonia sp.]|uniref:hypothetical protein n=1 Tax=uncultured Dokdonia sp. TaxID=575653 RepID=UPI002625D922|nr:hypothetical protein [uncultured Dokdonia sp.]